MKTDQLVRSIRMQMGQDQGYGVRVEASDAQIVHAIRLALAEYLRYHPVKSHQSFTALKGMYVYTPDPPVDSIVEFNYTEKLYADLTSPESALLGGRLILLGAAYPFTSPYTFAIYRHWLEVGQKIFSGKPDWRFVPEDGKLYLYVPQQDILVSFVGGLKADAAFAEEETWDPDFVENPENTDPTPPRTGQLDSILTLIKDHHITAWIRRLAFAKTKEMVGYQRRKYGGVPGSDKQTLQMDGADLIREGLDLWDKTFRDMFQSAPNIPPTMG